MIDVMNSDLSRNAQLTNLHHRRHHWFFILTITPNQNFSINLFFLYLFELLLLLLMRYASLIAILLPSLPQPFLLFLFTSFPSSFGAPFPFSHAGAFGILHLL